MVSHFVWPVTLSLFMKFLSKSMKLHWGTGVSGNFSANCSCTKSVYLLPSQKTYSTRKTRSSIKRTIVSKNWIKQLNTLLVLPFNCLTTEYSEIPHNNSTPQQQLRYWQLNLRRLRLTGYPLHSPVSPSLPIPCVTAWHHSSTGLYRSLSAQQLSERMV